MAAGRRGKKRIARLAKELRMNWPEVCALLGEIDGSDREWTHFNQVVSAELERRLRSYLESSSQEIPAPPAPPMRGDAPVTVPRPAAPIKVDVRGGGREMDARGALHLASRLWPLPRRFQPGHDVVQLTGVLGGQGGHHGAGIARSRLLVDEAILLQTAYGLPHRGAAHPQSLRQLPLHDP